MSGKASSALFAALAIGLVIAGCGGASDPLTRAEFLERGNAICRQTQQERDAAAKEVAKEGAPGSEGSSQSGLEAFVTEVALPPIQKMTEELAGLKPPKRDEKQVAAIIAGFEKGIAKLEANPQGPAIVNAFSSADKQAEAYGLNNCTI